MVLTPCAARRSSEEIRKSRELKDLADRGDLVDWGCVAQQSSTWKTAGRERTWQVLSLPQYASSRS